MKHKREETIEHDGSVFDPQHDLISLIVIQICLLEQQYEKVDVCGFGSLSSISVFTIIK